jgi:hypothetical protein
MTFESFERTLRAQKAGVVFFYSFPFTFFVSQLALLSIQVFKYSSDDCGQTFIKKDFKNFHYTYTLILIQQQHHSKQHFQVSRTKRSEMVNVLWMEKDLLFLKLLTCAHFKMKIGEWRHIRERESRKWRREKVGE